MKHRSKYASAVMFAAAATLSLTGSAYASDGGTTINDVTNISTVSSTVDPTNKDQNPYALAIDTRPGSGTYGQLFVSNFSNAKGVNGAGTTIEHIVSGQPETFSTLANGPAAMAFSPKGPLWIADFGQSGSDGNVLVTKPNGTSFGSGGTITNAAVAGPWGQAFAGPFTDASGTSVGPAFFVTGAQNGTVAAMYGFSPPDFAGSTTFTVIGSGLAWSGSTANDIQGPQGLVWDSTNHVLYVTDTADSSIRSFTWDGPNTPNQGTGTLVYQGGALNHPVGIAINPINGDLLVVNQGDNNIVELSHGADGVKVVGVRSLDTGAAGALFGIVAQEDANGHLLVDYTDDNTNTIDQLSYDNPLTGALPEVPLSGLLPLIALVGGYGLWRKTRKATR